MAITLLSQLFAGAPQFFNHLQHAQMLSRALFEAQLQIFAQQRAIHIAHEIAARCRCPQQLIPSRRSIAQRPQVQPCTPGHDFREVKAK